jgi:beta-galactosidase
MDFVNTYTLLKLASNMKKNSSSHNFYAMHEVRLSELHQAPLKELELKNDSQCQSVPVVFQVRDHFRSKFQSIYQQMKGSGCWLRSLQWICFMLFLATLQCPSLLAANLRERYAINDHDWKFMRAEVEKGFETSLNDKDWLNVSIPHDFNGGSDGVHNDVFKGRFDVKNDPDQRLMYKGPGWYRTKLTIDKSHAGKRVSLEFEAVSLAAQIWINGQFVGKHQGGYTAFSFDITNYIEFGKENLLAVRADNSNDPLIAPWMADESLAYPNAFDYALYGGIYRDVWITVSDPVKIEKVFNTPMAGQAGPTSLLIATYINNAATEAKQVTLTSVIVDPKGNEIAKVNMTKSVAVGESKKFTQMLTNLGEVYLWDSNTPNLYSVQSSISYDGKQADNFSSIFGIRYYTLSNGQAFSVNGKDRLIRGVNRHQDMEGVGYALTNEQHWQDAQMIKDVGFNFVRHAHYPCDREFARACDELGLMLWLEIPVTCSISAEPGFLENAKSQLKEMIEQYYNNPSVMIWSLGNEADRSGANESVSNQFFSELQKLAKSLDKRRVTTICNMQFQSNQKIVDTYSPQDWKGWYDGAIKDYHPNEMIGEYGASINYALHSEETFDIGKNYNAHGRPEFWSQEYGALLLEYKLSQGEKRMDQFPGHFVWVMYDFASPRMDRVNNPINYMNMKGLVKHDHKTKKDAFYLYQSMYREAKDFPMVYIVSESWTDRWQQPAKKDVWIYSNCESVELFNDKGMKISFGQRQKVAGPNGDTRFQWDEADVKYNVLHAVGYVGGQAVAVHNIELENLPEAPQ